MSTQGKYPHSIAIFHNTNCRGAITTTYNLQPPYRGVAPQSAHCGNMAAALPLERNFARVLAVLFCCASSSHIIARQNIRKDFVHAIRENLRRNNDDYIESSPLNNKSLSTEDNKQTKTSAAIKNNIFKADGNNGNITAMNAVVRSGLKYNGKPFNDGNQNTLVLPSSQTNKHYNIVKIDNKTGVVEATGGTVIQSIPVEMKIQSSLKSTPNEQAAKLISVPKIADKNTNLLMKLMRKQPQETRSNYETVTKPINVPRKSFKGMIALRGDMDHTEDKSPITVLDLDMVPAIGSKIHSMRERGRLCQRSVLLPEGPKYDSQGHIYLPAYTSRSRDYSNTRHPKLVLPRCCNCCRKSVLGCD
ncbi:hypothetical protein ACJJTC_002062 [Scirpophaga incertulas]